MEVAAGIAMFDTLLAGWEHVTAAYLVAGTQPALVETGAQTSVPAVRHALAEMGLGSDDLAWIVLTHVHLDHCGGVGDLAMSFPRATIVVHERGAPHLVDPTRLVAGSAVVYADRMPLYGGLTPVPENRIMVVGDGTRIGLGGSRELTIIDSPGHARHHVAVLDEATGTLMAGDALGVQLPGAGLFPAIPPPEFDLDQSLASLRRLAEIAPEVLLLGHYGPVPDPQDAITLAAERQTIAAETAWDAWLADGPTAVAEAVAKALPLAPIVQDATAIETWHRLGWADNNIAGLVRWAERRSGSTA